MRSQGYSTDPVDACKVELIPNRGQHEHIQESPGRRPACGVVCDHTRCGPRLGDEWRVKMKTIYGNISITEQIQAPFLEGRGAARRSAAPE